MDARTNHSRGETELSMAYGDLHRSASRLQEILRFISSSKTNSTELAAIRKAVQKQANQLRLRGRRGRPRAWDSIDWIQKAMTAAFRKRVLGWSWPKVTESMGLKPTKPNIRTLQRREIKFAEFIWNAMPPFSSWEDGQFGREVKRTVLAGC